MGSDTGKCNMQASRPAYVNVVVVGVVDDAFASVVRRNLLAVMNLGTLQGAHALEPAGKFSAMHGLMDGMIY